MFDYIDLHLVRPLCEHLPEDHKETWRWYFTQSTDGGKKKVELHVYCQVCKRRASINVKDVPVQFLVDDELASESQAPPSPESSEAVNDRVKRQTFERDFTPFDRSHCKRMGIKYEGK